MEVFPLIKDLRDYLDLLREKGWLDTITEPRSLDTLAATMREQEKKERTILFDHIEGYDCPMVNNLFANRAFLAAVFDCPVEEVTRVFSQRYEQRVTPVLVDQAPVQEHVYTGADIDVLRFPFLQHAPKDAGRYISAGVVIAKDPETGVRNCSINRMQLKGRDYTGFRMSPRQDLEAYYNKAKALGQNLELAVVIGNHPIDLLAAACGPARDVDELEIAGALRGEPVEPFLNLMSIAPKSSISIFLKNVPLSQ